MVLVDTSSWIHLLRSSGDGAVRARVEQIMASGDACWCPPVRLELWNGARGAHEKKVLKDFERRLPELPITETVWDEAYDLARRAKAAGVNVPSTDILIAACARAHGVLLETCDKDFEALSKLKLS